MKSFITYKVVNPELFKSVDEVELDLKSYERHFQGTVSVEINNQGWTTITGQHGADDYVENFGFKIIK